MKDIRSFDEFRKLFPDEKHCLDYLYAMRWSNGFTCSRCGTNEYWEVSPYKYKCRNCGYQSTVTAGTLFHHTHLPLTKWFYAAWYLTNVNNKAKADEIKDLLNLGSTKTAQSIIKKLKSIMLHDNFETIKLKGLVEISCKSIDADTVVYLAVELLNRNIHGIKMAYYQIDDEETFTDFVLKSVEDNSVLQLSYPLRKIGELRYYKLPDLLEEKGMTFKLRKYTYEYQFVENVFRDFLDYYDEYAFSPEFIDEAIYNYTLIVNSFNPDISFEKLMQNAIENYTVDTKRLPYYKMKRRYT